MEFIKFCISSFISNSVGFFSFASLFALGYSIFTSLGFSYFISFIVSILFNQFFVFNKYTLKIIPIIINFFLYVALLIFNVIIVDLGLNNYNLSPFVTQFFIMFMIILINYFIQKYLYSFSASSNH
jgi:hypothetical protein